MPRQLSKGVGGNCGGGLGPAAVACRLFPSWCGGVGEEAPAPRAISSAVGVTLPWAAAAAFASSLAAVRLSLTDRNLGRSEGDAALGDSVNHGCCSREGGRIVSAP
jgi:hypothetical protein